MQLKELLKFQKRPQNDSEAKESQSLVPCMKFTYQGACFLISIRFVKEIIEGHLIIPYPKAHNHHVGLVNLRGQIIPVVRPSYYLGISPVKAERLMLIELANQSCYCIEVDRVQKLSVSEELLNQKVVNIDQIPIKVIQEFELNHMDQSDGPSCEKNAS